LAIPKVPFKIKEFAYFGFAITLVSASIAHFARGDAHLGPLFAFFIIDPLIFLAVLMVSYFYFQKSIVTVTAGTSKSWMTTLRVLACHPRLRIQDRICRSMQTSSEARKPMRNEIISPDL
jgi:hypothetical protein